MTEFKYIVKAEDKELSVKELLRHNFNFSARLRAKLKYNHLVYLNGEKVDGWITPSVGDIITVKLPEETSDFPPENIPIEVIYEDSDILIINKQPGVVVHPTKGKPCHTLANGLMKRILDTGENYKIRFANRLDMDTSGLLIIAKNSHAQDNITKQMKSDDFKKKYKAVVYGIIAEDEGIIDLPLGRPYDDEVERWVVPEENGGYPSITRYKVLERFPAKDSTSKGYSFVELQLETGRTHQIRVHLSYIGHPIVGDTLYSGGDPFEYRRLHGDVKNENGDRPEFLSTLISRQALHAYYLSFCHPVSGEVLEFEAPLPEDICKLLKSI